MTADAVMQVARQPAALLLAHQARRLDLLLPRQRRQLGLALGQPDVEDLVGAVEPVEAVGHAAAQHGDDAHDIEQPGMRRVQTQRMLGQGRGDVEVAQQEPGGQRRRDQHDARIDVAAPQGAPGHDAARGNRAGANDDGTRRGRDHAGQRRADDGAHEQCGGDGDRAEQEGPWWPQFDQQQRQDRGEQSPGRHEGHQVRQHRSQHRLEAQEHGDVLDDGERHEDGDPGQQGAARAHQPGQQDAGTQQNLDGEAHGPDVDIEEVAPFEGRHQRGLAAEIELRQIDRQGEGTGLDHEGQAIRLAGRPRGGKRTRTGAPRTGPIHTLWSALS